MLPEHLPRHVYLKNYRLIGIQAYDMNLMEVEKYIEVFRREALEVDTGAERVCREYEQEG